LPSVDAGAVLTDILPEKLELSFSYEFTEFYSKKYNKYDLEFGSKKKNIFTDHIVFLKKSFRSQKKILEIAELINLQKSEVLNYFSKINMENFSDNFTGIYFIRDDEIKLYDLLDKWFEKNFLFKVVKSYKFIDLISKKYDFEKYDDINLLFYLFEFYFSSIVLGLVKNGINGTINMNRYFTAKLGDLQNVSYDFFPGLPIMITQNDYKNNLFNGEIGILVLDKFSELRAIFRNGDRILNFSLNDLNSFEIAFSVTVHKSQGSEYENVLLILPEKDSRILSKEIIYTGITRAKIMVLMYGKTEIFNECLNRKINRKSGFFKIKKNID
jgi:exodeoxyribonuclease V alpha subunit